MTGTIIALLAIVFVATLVRSTLGFGESLIAVPLFLFFLPSNVAVPLAVMLSILVAFIIVLQDHSKIHWESAKWLIIFALLGIPLGLLVLLYGHETLIKIGLGILLITYSLYSLFGKATLTLREDSKFWLFMCGFFSGFLGGAYGLNGPPLVIYGNLRRWTATHFRATLQAYFLPASFIGFTGYALNGLVTAQVIHYFSFSLLTALPAIFLGRYLNGKLNDRSFFVYAYWGLMAIGVMLVINSLVA